MNPFLKTIPLVALAAALVAVAPAASAQTTPNGRLVVTVIDQTGAVIPSAPVTLTPQEGAALEAGTRIMATSPVGVAVFDRLVPGRYTLQVEFPGFETGVFRDLRIRAGDTRRTVLLQIAKIDQEVNVTRDRQSAALDPLGAAFSTVLTREQIDALPDDPDEMERVLTAMAPPGAIIRVDGFTGGKLPPKSQIRSIRLPRMDTMAAQNHGGSGGAMHIDIMTQPGLGPMRGSVDFAFRDDVLNARNPFAPVKGDESLKRYGASLSGSIRPNSSSYAVTFQRNDQVDSANLLAAGPSGTVAAPVRQPLESYVVTGRFDQAVRKDHALRVSFQRTDTSRRNLGIGGYDLPERAYASESADNLLRLSENGPLGRRFFTESRLQVRWFGSDSRSAVEARTIRVLDAFTSGGAQMAGGSNALEFEAASDLDYVRGRHSWRTGILVEGGSYHADERSNYLGTYTFSSTGDFEAGTPSNYTRRVGDPDVRYSNLQAGLYIQDDFRLVRSVMLSYGLRYEVQSLVSDYNNLTPRVSVTWAPFPSGRTTIRGGWGWFDDWLSTSVYQQTIQVDGYKQRELNILNPSYPDPGTDGSIPPTNRYLLGDGLVLPGSMSLNAGIDQQVAGSLRVSAAYTYRRGRSLLRGSNRNAPVDGVRPDPSFSNVIEVTPDAASRAHSLNLGANMILLNWHRTFFAANYTYTRSDTNTSGAFSLPASGDDVSREWGPTLPRHRFGGQFSTEPVRNLGVSVSVRAQSGSPYNITTGLDDNSDGVFTDRPAGVGRNAALTAWQWDIGARLSYAIGFGPQRQTGGGGGTQVMVAIGGSGGGMPAGGISVSGASDKRFRLEFYASAQNITNHDNYTGNSGVMTSPFFGQPTTVLNPRKIELGARFGF